ncbi:MAG TPA: TonB-dependent receptor, partial [Kiloniellales bacterium]|nr:TonB-dependent receptor [Kiloniellales bacterium]
MAPETVVSASRVPIPAEQAGSTVTVITAEEIEQRQAVYVSDVLRDVPGLAVNRAGAVGNTTQVRIRGAEANQTLVLIDGIEVADPTVSEFNFGHLLASDIERIEVIRGPQSALWGADAIGGVINIITKRGRRGLTAEASAEGGSFTTRQGNASLRGGTERLTGALSATWFATNGTNIARRGDEEDEAENKTLFANGGVQVFDNLRLDLSGRYMDTMNQFDPQDFDFPATPTNGLAVDGDEVQETEQLFGRAQTTLDLLDGRWEHRLGAAYSGVEKIFTTDGARTSRNKGDKLKLDYQTSLRFETPEIADAAHTVILLVEQEREDFLNEGADPGAPENQKEDRHATGLVGEYRLDLWESLFLSGAIRHDVNSDFADATTWRASAAYVVPRVETRLHGSYSTGVTNPTFFEQFGFFPDSFVGNPDVEPEKSEGWEIGVEQPFWDRRLVLDVTWFETDLEDEIVTTFDPMTFFFSVDNQPGRSRRRGVEVSLAAEPLPGLTLDAAYTYTDASEPNGLEEIRRPRHIASLNVNRRFLDGRADLGLSVRYTGPQIDSEFSANTPEDRVELDDFTLVDV